MTWTDDRLAVLSQLCAANQTSRIVVIGAVAVAHHLGETFRATVDLDLCVASPVAELRVPDSWRGQAVPPHRWTTAEGVKVDLIAVGDLDLARGFVGWPDGSKLDLGGVELALRDCSPIGFELPELACVATLRALFVCKVMAWLDRSWERRKDLGDLAQILDRYVESDDPRCYDPAIPLDLEIDERPAFLLGVDVAQVCHGERLGSFTTFLGDVGDERRASHSVMSARWPSNATALVRRLAAFRRGMSITR